MYYGNLKKCDIANGIGVRVTLFVSGCTNHCPDCFQPQTWDFHYGKPFTDDTEREIFAELDKSYVDGLTVLRTLRARGSALPVLLLTARDAVADRVDGLDAGADDYLIKPFALDELLARLRVLTRKKGSGSTNVYTLADLTVDTAARTAKRGDRTLELSAREYALLEYLIRSKGVVLSRQQIEDNLWSLDYAGGTNVVDVYISYLRKKLELPGEQKLLHTVRGMGWVLKEDA